MGTARIIVGGSALSLGALGVPNALSNATPDRRVSNAAPLTNNNWQDNPTYAPELIAADLAPTNRHESGIADAPAGSYTALLSGVNDGTGVGLGEIYDRGSP